MKFKNMIRAGVLCLLLNSSVQASTLFSSASQNSEMSMGLSQADIFGILAKAAFYWEIPISQIEREYYIGFVVINQEGTNSFRVTRGGGESIIVDWECH